MIQVKHAPAGHIGQLFADPDPRKPGCRTRFLDVTGNWCETEEDALEDVRGRARSHRLKLLDAQIKRLAEKLECLRKLADQIRDQRNYEIVRKA